MPFWKALFPNLILIKHSQRYQEINRIHNCHRDLILIQPAKLTKRTIKSIMIIQENLISHQRSLTIINPKKVKAL